MVLLLALLDSEAQAVTINFDDQTSAPCCFPGIQPGSIYAAQGLTFTAGNFAIVDVPSGGWSVTGWSPNKALAWNSCCTTLSETWTYSSSMSSVSIRVGVAGSASITMQAYDSVGTLIGSNSGTYGTSMGTLSVSVPGIRRVVLTVSGGAGLVDDMVFTPGSGTPPNAVANGPYTAPRGIATTLNGSGSNDPDGVITKYEWDCTNDGTYDGNSTSPTGVACTYNTLGTFTARLRVTDNSALTGTATATVNVTNRLPTAVANGPYSGTRTAPVALSGAGSSDPDGTIAKYEWDCTNDGTYDGNSTSATGVSCSYAALGSFTARLRVTDNNGGTATATSTVTITNLPPTAEANGPYTGDEGAPIAMSSAGASDPDGSPTYAWDCNNDGTYEASGASPSCTFADNGTFTVRQRITDADGATATDTASVTVANVAPTITTTATATATEGTSYAYDANATDPGADTLTWSLDSAPSGATIDPGTGVIAWVPTYAQTDAPVSFTVTATDDDGGTTSQSFTVQAAFKDADGDAMADTWEAANGLNPALADASADPDADGLTNLEEFTLDQDPQVYDGPTAPVALSPIDGDDTPDAMPSLELTNATDPQDDALTYTFEVFAESDLTTPVAMESGVPETAGTTIWLTNQSLDENGRYQWRARANDGNVDGPWSTPAEFRVNGENDAPDAPVAVFPVDESVANFTPTLQWSPAVDPDGDPVTYDVEVWSSDGELVTSVDGVADASPSVEWVVDAPLENGSYEWRVAAVDSHGLASPFTTSEFDVAADVQGPTGVAFTAPADGERVDGFSPTLVASEGTDAEGATVQYHFEIDTVASFDSSDYVDAIVDGNGDGTATWDLADDGIVLPENGVVFARVRGIDEVGNASAPDTISFYVIGENEAPIGLELLSPLPATLLTGSTPFTCRLATDPEGTEVRYEFVLASDEALTDIIAETDGPIPGELGGAIWEPTVVPADGLVYWSARAVDADGIATDWEAPWGVTFTSGEDPGTEEPGKCGCASPGTAVGGVFPALLGLLLFRRRRS